MIEKEKQKLIESGPNKVINDDEVSIKTHSDFEEEKKQLIEEVKE